ncbi:MAG: rhomboid family intramembrane serine protease [Bacteroidales bacterium]|nr:rhomboid family intramembrane serine protease [Bacteroidales bacterium]
MNYYSYRQRVPMVVKNLIIINVIMLIFTMVSEPFMYKTFSLYYFGSPLFHPFQFISYMFMHGGFSHLLFNMFSLYMFGSVLENVWGAKKFFLYYMVTGIGAGIIHELVMYLQIITTSIPHEAYIIANTPTVGASGAIYGLLLAYGMLFPNNIISFIFPPISMKAKWMVLIFGVMEFIFGVTGTGGNIAHFAHLGGMIFGIILILYWKKKNRLYY